MRKFERLKAVFLASLALILSGVTNLFLPLATHADVEVGITPVRAQIVLQPGQVYTSSFEVYNNGDEDLHFKTYASPYAITSDESGDVTQIYDDDANAAASNYTQMADWIEVEAESDTVHGGQGTVAVNFTITVPEDATPGGQYAAIMVEKINDESENEANAALENIIRNAYLIYATVAGNVTETASISDVNIPGIFVDSKITASSMVENTGNVHGTASYTLQVFPLFSDEEVYTTEEEPETHIIYPGTKYYNQLTWEDTPSIGIYRVVETVSLFGESTSTERIVVVCPLWLILVIVFAIVFIVVWLIIRSKKRKHAKGTQNA